MKTAGVSDYTNQTTPNRHFGWIKCINPTSLKNKKIFNNVHKMGGAYLQCVNNHYAKFENKEMKQLELQITQNRHHQSIFGRKNV